MDAQNTWGLLSPQDKMLAQMGMQGLQSGAIDPSTAMDHASSYIGLDPMSSMSSKPMTPGANPSISPPGGFASLLDMSQNPMANVNTKTPGAKKLSTQTATQTSSGKTNKNTYLNPDEYDSIRSTLVNTPEMQSQQEGADKLQNMLDMNADFLGKQASRINLAPLMALADSQTGSNLSKGYTQPEAPQDMMSKLADFATKVQAKKEDISKQIMSGVKDLKSGSSQDAYIQAMKDAQTAGLGGTGAGANSLSNVRKAALIQATGASFDKDQLMKNLNNTNNNLDRATSMMNGKTPITNKNFALLQQDMINAMAPGGAATEGKVNREMVTTLAGTLNDLNAKFGDIKDLRNEQPQVFAQLQGLISQVKNDYAKAAHDRIGEIEQNSTGNPIPEVEQAAKNKADLLRKKFSVQPEAPAKPHDMPIGTKLNGMTKTAQGWVPDNG
jgi:hypothetical protein